MSAEECPLRAIGMRVDVGCSIILAGILIASAIIYDGMASRAATLCNSVRQTLMPSDTGLMPLGQSGGQITAKAAIERASRLLGFDPAACGMLNFESPTEASIQLLQQKPEYAATFDARFGPGESVKYLPRERDVDYLRDHPDAREKFEKQFGPGSADRYLKLFPSDGDGLP